MMKQIVLSLAVLAVAFAPAGAASHKEMENPHEGMDMEKMMEGHGDMKGHDMKKMHGKHHKPHLKIYEPKDGATVSSPVKVCFATVGVEVEKAGKVNEGKGHHHILIDADIPKDLGKPLPKNKHFVHMGDGSACKEVELKKGKHTLRGLFADGAHVPYDPALTDAVTVTVK